MGEVEGTTVSFHPGTNSASGQQQSPFPQQAEASDECNDL